MKILVTGAGGQLGYDTCEVLTVRNIEHRGVDRADFDITDAKTTHDYIVNYCPDAVIHCAAYTNVERAETEPELCWAVNQKGTEHIARACREAGAKLMYISSDYVFPGNGVAPYEPEDATGPLNVYGQSKLAGEQAVRECLENCFVVRSSWAFGKKGSNFVKAMLRQAESRRRVQVVCDQIGSPTYTADLANLLCDMIMTERYGVYHATNEGYCSWAEFAGEIFRLSGRSVRVEPIPTEEYPAQAVRPKNSRMSKGRLEEAGFHRLPGWRDGLKRYLAEIGVNGTCPAQKRS